MNKKSDKNIFILIWREVTRILKSRCCLLILCDTSLCCLSWCSPRAWKNVFVSGCVSITHKQRISLWKIHELRDCFVGLIIFVPFSIYDRRNIPIARVILDACKIYTKFMLTCISSTYFHTLICVWYPMNFKTF